MKRIYLHDFSPNLSGDEHHYLKNVLRLHEGDMISILTAHQLLEAKILSMDKKSSHLEATSSRPVIPSLFEVTAYQCILKREYMDTVIEKYTELGVTRIVPVISARSMNEVKDSAARRYREIAKSATLQCEREQLPIITEAVRIENVKALPDATNIVFYERGERSIEPQKLSNHVNFVVGPEGGFTEQEVISLTQKGFSSVTPFSQILKAETAATVFAGWLMIQLEATNGS